MRRRALGQRRPVPRAAPPEHGRREVAVDRLRAGAEVAIERIVRGEDANPVAQARLTDLEPGIAPREQSENGTSAALGIPSGLTREGLRESLLLSFVWSGEPVSAGP